MINTLNLMRRIIDVGLFSPIPPLCNPFPPRDRGAAKVGRYIFTENKICSRTCYQNRWFPLSRKCSSLKNNNRYDIPTASVQEIPKVNIPHPKTV